MFFKKKKIKYKLTNYNCAYLVVVNFCEEETYFFNDIDEMFDFCKASTINQCIEYFTDMYSIVTIYKVICSYEEI